MDEELFVVAEAVEGIENWIFCGFVGVEIIGKDDAVGNGAGEDFGGKEIAFYAAGGRGGGEVEEGEEEEERGPCSVACDPKRKPRRGDVATVPPLRGRRSRGANEGKGRALRPG
jgi:hypothetical protein